MSMKPEAAEYSIAAVSKLTGVGCHALRVWERRYGFPVPHRSASGHRRYSPEQVQVLLAITGMLESGRPISDLIAEFLAGRLAVPSPPRPDEIVPEGGKGEGEEKG